MAVSAIVAALSTATAAIGGTLFFGSIAAHFLITTAMGAALNALTPKPKIGAGAQGYSLSGQSGAALDQQIIYGEARVGGARIYDSSTGGSNQFLHRILAFAGHEVDSYQDIYLNDEIVTLDGNGFVTSPSQYNGKVRIKKYLGTTTQTADTDLVSETAGLIDGRWTTDHRLQGIAYIYVRFEYNQDSFPNGVPAVSAKIRGKKVFDPRTSTTAWSDNPALCLRDYLTSNYGLSQPSGRIDDALVNTAADICEETVEGEDRYTCNGAFTTGLDPSVIASNLLSSMGGLLWYGQGKWRMKAAAWTAPTVSFDENDLRSGISLSTRHSRRDNFNSVKGTFAGDETDWQVTDYPQVSDPAFLTADNNLVNVLDFALPFTSSSLTAQRIARIALNRNREQLTFSASFGMRAFQVQVGDFVNITNSRFGWSNKPFEIVEWTFGLQDNLEILVNMTLREISEGVFTGVNGQAFELNNTTLPDPFAGMTVSELGATSGGGFTSDGTFLPSIVLSWTAASNSFVSHYEVEWRQTSESDYSSLTTSDDSVEIGPILDGTDYTARIRAVSILGNRGSFASISFNASGDSSAPSAPTSLSATAGPRLVSLSWVNPVASDLQKINIYQKGTASPAPIIGTDVPIASVVGESFIVENLLPLAEKFYWVTAVDYSGNESVLSSSASATPTLLNGTQIEDLTLDTIKLVDSAVTKIITFSSVLPFIQNFPSYPIGPPFSNVDYYGDSFKILDYVDNPETRPDIFGALRYSVSGTTSGTPELKLETLIAFVGSGGGTVILAGTETYLSGDDVYGQHMHNVTYASKFNLNGAGFIFTRAYITGVSSPNISVQGYGMARQR
jgi:hypothetical protein